MNEFDIHILVMCIMVFVLLVSISSSLLAVIYKQTISLIKYGAYDDKIIKECEHVDKKRRNKAWRIINIIIQVLLWGILVTIIILNFTIGTGNNKLVGEHGSIKTVESSSMSYADVHNEYLKEYNLTTQVGTDDLIKLEKLPSEENIQLYDVIMYENKSNNRMILHRIVGMYDDYDDAGNKVRYYVFRGDAVPVDDGNVVTYEDMRGIYRGDHVKYIGSFIRFMHSPVGYICLSFAIVLLVAMPFFDRKIAKTKAERMMKIGTKLEE